jgi:hypothetical protein
MYSVTSFAAGRWLHHWLLDIGCWLLSVGYCLLAIGYWLLDFGYWLLAICLVNRLDTALHITALLHGLYVGVIPIWGGLARPNGRASWHDQMPIELNSLGLNVGTSSSG